MTKPLPYRQAPVAPLAEPFQMCSREECEEREKTYQVSIWEQRQDDDDEAEPNHAKRGQRRRRRIDPQRAVQKYRRAAAGGKDERPRRSRLDLCVTVDYLLALLAHSGTASDNCNLEQQSFLSLVQFWEDRVRAVQTDLVKLQDGDDAAAEIRRRIRTCHVRLTRAHILVLYLLADCSSYESSFGQRALATSLSQFWQHHPALDPARQPPQQHLEHVDEMLAMDVLFQLQKELLQQQCQSSDEDDEKATSRLSGVLETYRSTLLHNNTHWDVQLPLFQWALQLVVDASLGHWYCLLQRLARPATKDPEAPPSPRIAMLARCLVAPALPFLRYKALQAYNVSWRKGEGLVDAELARLLHLPNRQSAVTLAQQYGLPTTALSSTAAEGQDDDDAAVVSLQSVPIQPFLVSVDERKKGQQQQQHLRNENDEFVFGTTTTTTVVEGETFWRRDAEGIRIPCHKWMKDVLFLD